MSRKFRVLALVAVFGAAVAALSGAAGRSSAAAHAVTPMTQIGHSMVLDGQVPDAGGIVNPTGQVGPLRGCQTTGVCYGPDQIQKAYGFDKLYAKGLDGTGRTIVIIDAYGSPTLGSDIALFDSYFGLPTINLQTVYPDGPPDATSVSNGFGWAAETTLDVSWAHAVAPGAKIVLVVAKSNNDSDILSATQWVADNNAGDVVSQSYGEAEECMGTTLLNQQHTVFSQLAKKNITLFASSGDQGAALPNCDGTGYFKRASTPATDPQVTAVGGTQLFAQPATSLANPGGNWLNEVTWNEGDGSATGGGLSLYYSRPDYQAPVIKDSKAREVPDIAYNAAVNGGVLAVLTCPGPAACGAPAGTYFFRFGGTSAGSPQWAALTAITDQAAGGRVGDINKTLYKLGKGKSAGTYFHDITVGDNSQPGLGVPDGFAAVPGWDAATGWGSPQADTLVPAIAKPGNG